MDPDLPYNQPTVRRIIGKLTASNWALLYEVRAGSKTASLVLRFAGVVDPKGPSLVLVNRALSRTSPINSLSVGAWCLKVGPPTLRPL